MGNIKRYDKKQDLSPFRELQLIAQLKPSMLTL